MRYRDKVGSVQICVSPHVYLLSLNLDDKQVNTFQAAEMICLRGLARVAQLEIEESMRWVPEPSRRRGRRFMHVHKMRAYEISNSFTLTIHSLSFTGFRIVIILLYIIPAHKYISLPVLSVRVRFLWSMSGRYFKGLIRNALGSCPFTPSCIEQANSPGTEHLRRLSLITASSDLRPIKSS